MSNNKKGGAGHPPLDTQTADKLLELLSTDDDFRELFVKDRQAALKNVGYPEYTNATVQCTSVEQMASKEEIAAARDELKSHLTSSAALTVVFCFEANQVTSILRKK